MTRTVRPRVADVGAVPEIPRWTLSKEALDEIASDTRIPATLRSHFPSLDSDDEDFITAKTAKTVLSANSKTTYYTAPSGPKLKHEASPNRLQE
jgi:hypothetical protein